MVLVIDVGNTNVVFGVYNQNQLLHYWRIQTDHDATEDEYMVKIKNLIVHKGLEIEKIDGVIISSVVPPLTRVLCRMTEKYFHTDPVVLSNELDTGLTIDIDHPREMGADRIANAVAAIERYGAPAIVVDFGTATNFCCIDENGHYRGGAFAPGVNISAEALYQKAAQLTRIEIKKPEQIIGRNTIQAMQSGVFYGYVSLVNGLVQKMKKEFVQTPTVIATGGLAPLFGKEAEEIDVVDSLLTLEGLNRIYLRVQKEEKG